MQQSWWAVGGFWRGIGDRSATLASRLLPWVLFWGLTAGAQAQTIIGPVAVPDATVGAPYSHALRSSVGTAPFSYSLAFASVPPIPRQFLPPGITLTSDGLLSGTPRGAGGFDFILSVTDGAGVVSFQRHRMNIAPPVLTLRSVPRGSRIAGDNYLEYFNASGGTAPYRYQLTGALPDGMAFADNLLSGRPRQPGTYTFTVSAADSSVGVGAPFTVTEVYTLTITADVPTGTAHQATTGAATPVHVPLTSGARGGPFTGATVVSVSPANSGTTFIEAKTNPSGGNFYTLTFTPDRAFAGVAVLRYTLSTALATSAEATVTIIVLPRPDPSLDPEVRGLVDAQVESARRFAGSQVDNFQQRLERLHGGGEGGFDNGLGFAIDRPCIEPLAGGRIDPCRPDASGLRGGNGLSGSTSGPATTGGPGSGGGPVGTWMGGMIRSGSHDGRNGGVDIDFETDGLSAGIDYRFSDGLVVGAGFGYGKDENAIGGEGSRVDGDARTVALYASYHPGRMFVDMLLGYQWLDYDLRRHLTGNGGTVNGQRDGRQRFASVSVGADFVSDNSRATPYARLDVAQADLGAYTETGDPLHALTFAAMDADGTTANLGVRMESRHHRPWGRITPQFRLEYQHDLSGRSDAVIRYADLVGGPVYGLSATGSGNSRVIVGLGALLDFDSGWSGGLEYRAQVGSSGDSGSGMSVNLQKQF